MIILDEPLEHGTPAGYKAGCKGIGGCDPDAPWTCAQAMQRYRGDWTFKRRVDAGMTPAEIAELEAAERREQRMRTRAEATTATPVAIDASSPSPPRRAALAHQSTATSKVRAIPTPKRSAKAKPAAKGTPKPRGAARADRPHGVHGTPSGYTRGCRLGDQCPAKLAGGTSCQEANRDYHREYRQRRRREVEQLGPAAVRGHGTPYGYAQGCRAGCPATPTCSQAARAYEAAARRTRGTAPRTPPAHGTRGGYRAGCRGTDCPATPSCADANRAYGRQARDRRKARA